MSASALALFGMMLRFSPPATMVQLTVVPLSGSPGSLSCTSWCASSSTALRPSSGAEPAWEDLPFTSSITALMPLVAVVTASLSGGS